MCIRDSIGCGGIANSKHLPALTSQKDKCEIVAFCDITVSYTHLDVYKRQTSGSVTIRGKELLKMKDEELTIFRRRNIGFVFQNYNLLPVLNVYENIVYPIEIDGGKTRCV